MNFPIIEQKGKGHNSKPNLFKQNNKLYGDSKASKSLQKKGITFSKAPRKINEIKQKYFPGPCNYQTLILDKPKPISFAKAERKAEGMKAGTPGPTTYDSVRFQQNFKGTEYTFLGKDYPEDNEKLYPGPGDYDIDAKNKREKTFTKATRFKKSLQKLPGPGDYQLGENISKSISKTKSINNLKSHKQVQPTPGPGDYNLKNEIDSNILVKRGPTMGDKFLREKSSISVNSFNKYFQKGFPTQLIKSKSKAYSIGKSLHQKNQNSSPGPGEYQYTTTIFANSRNAVIPQGNLIHKGLVTPGPGTYEQESTLKESKVYSIKRQGSQFQVRDKNLNPGVGQYNITQQFSKKFQTNSGYTKQKRLNYISNNEVGIGAYNI